MTLIYFAYYNALGHLQECSYGGPNLESGLDMLTELINYGWKLTNIRIMRSNKSPITLPEALFDGNYFNEPMRKLQQEWEALLLPVS